MNNGSIGEIASPGQLRMAFVRWAGFVVPLVLLLGFLSGRSVATGDANPWYAALAKPAATPPGWVFPVAWSLLYILIGVALSMILAARGARLRWAGVALFVAQFVLNLAWTPLFFGAHRVHDAFVLILAIEALSILTTIVFARVRVAAAWLMVPYMVWIGFAGALTWGIDRLNPDARTLVPPAASSQVLG